MVLAFCYHPIAMSQILVRDLEPEIVEQLKRRARKNRRSLEQEVRLILEQAAEFARRQENLDEFIKLADRIAAESGPQTSDSTDLIREDRDR
jgi:plasmid stability protein